MISDNKGASSFLEPKNLHNFDSIEDVEVVAPVISDSIKSNGIFIYPTETVYGVGGGIDSESIDNLTHFKHRDSEKKFLLIISNPEMLKELHVEIPMEAEILVKAFWPSALTIVFKVQPDKRHLIDQRLLGEHGGIAVRQTGHKLLRRLIDKIGRPISSTSANLSGHAPATSIDDLVDLPGVDFHNNRIHVLNGGTLPPSMPSTIVDCSSGVPQLIREGAIKLEVLKRVIPI